jgi:DNA invertase Pin-like site-specific DNA recombinase
MTGCLIGLARVSTRAQDTKLQLDALNGAGCARIFEDTVSTRKPLAQRPETLAALDYCRKGDTLCVWKLDRLGRNTREVLEIAETLHERGIGLRILTGKIAGDYQPTGVGKFFFVILAGLAELERDLIHERVMAGLAASENKGGRPFVMDADKLAIARARRDNGESPTKIAKALGMSRATVYRHLAAAE